MKIAFLHMTMGVSIRGSEISTDIIASGLASAHGVLLLGAGKHQSKSYKYIQSTKLDTIAKSAPTNIYEKILFRLYKDQQSQQIKRFTNNSLDEIRKFDPDIIVPINGKTQIQIIKNNFPSKKIVIFGRAGIGWNDRDSIRSNPDLFIALSRKALAWASSVVDKNTGVTYIPNPVDVSHFKTSKSIEVDLAKPTVLVVAALTKYKNIDLVIKAVANTKASLVVLGTGEEESSLVALAGKLLPGRSVFASATYDELPGYFKSADAFCFMPDSQEAFGRVYIEAMAAGLPIVAPGDSIRKGIIGQNGIYSSYSPSEISQNLLKAIQIGKIDYSEELERFSSDVVVSKIESQLLSLINNLG